MSLMICSLRWRCLSVTVLVAILGCTTPGSAPDDMSAAEHRATAEARAVQATAHREQYDPYAVRVYSGGYFGPYGTYYGGFHADYNNGYRDYYWDVGDYNPTRGHLMEAQNLERHAVDHLAAAKALERFEDAGCAAFPHETRATCPLLGHVEAVDDVYGGVRLRFDEGTNVNAAVAHVRCHMAFARTRARVGMDTCPLYLRGIDAARVGDRTIELTAGDGEALEMLQTRSRHHLSAPVPEGP